MELFDTHAHLDDESFDEIRDEVIQRCTDAGVQNVIVVGTSADTSDKCISIARQYTIAHAAVGIQPNYCHEAKSDDWERIVKLADDPAVVAIGETGLDRYWDHCPFDVQQDYFARHIQLSIDFGKPFIVHMRDCDDDIRTALHAFKSQAPLSGVMHSFTGDAAFAAECIDLGLHISFAGMVTFKKSVELRKVAVTIPDEHLLIETDSPYLTPHPKRGQRPNEPSLVLHTCQCMAEARGVPVEKIAEITTANAKRFFGLS